MLIVFYSLDKDGFFVHWTHIISFDWPQVISVEITDTCNNDNGIISLDKVGSVHCIQMGLVKCFTAIPYYEHINVYPDFTIIVLFLSQGVLDNTCCI